MKKSQAAITAAIPSRFQKFNIRNTCIAIFKYAQSIFITLLASDLDKAFTSLIFIVVSLLTCYAIGGLK